MLLGVLAARVAVSGFGDASLNLTVGKVVGNVWTHAEEFLMIPYATAQRFEAPVPLHKLPGDAPFDATNIDGLGKAACAQPGFNGSGAYGVEACLIMNVYRPHGRAATKRPVLLWIFGGDNSASEIIPYNSSLLAARHDCIVVVVSYRLGGLGFAAFVEDGVNASGIGTGNNGMLDILAAAKWIQREADALGADATRIVAFGESSGATDAQILTLVGAARGVIAGSIAESGGLYANSLADAAAATKRMASSAGCHGVAEPIKVCMQKVDVAALMNGMGRESWGPTVDGVFLAAQPATLLAAPGLNPGTAVIYGANTNDSANTMIFDTFVGKKAYVAQLNATVRGAHAFGLAAEETASETVAVRIRHRRSHRSRRHRRRVLAAAAAAAAAREDARGMREAAPNASALLDRALTLYPPRVAFVDPAHFLGNNADLVGWFESDQFLCSTRREALAAALTGRTYLYRFDWFFQSTTTCVADSNYHDPRSGSNHCDEMSFVHGQPIFDNQDPPGLSYTNCSDPASVYYDAKRCVGCTFDAREANLSFALGRFWSGLARNGAPSAEEHEWPAFTAQSRRSIVLHPGATRVEEDMGRAAACQLWDDVANLQGAAFR